MGRIQQMSFHLFQKWVVIHLRCPTPKPHSLKQKSSMNSHWVWDRPHPVLKNTQLSPSTAPTATPVSECTADKARTVWCPGIAAISCTFPSHHGSFKGATRWKATALQVVSTHSINWQPFCVLVLQLSSCTMESHKVWDFLNLEKLLTMSTIENLVYSRKCFEPIVWKVYSCLILQHV